MANYSISIDTSNFKPFDLNAPLSVLRDYRDAYYRYEDALNKIAEENGMYQLPMPEGDNAQQQAIYDQYAKYNNDFREVSADFAKGMNWRNAQLVRDINRRYGLEAKPIKQAVENYNKFMENKNTIRANKQARFGKDPSVYDFVGGRVPQLEVLDAKDIQTGAAAMMKGLSSVIKDNPEIRKSIMEGYDLYMSGGLSQSNAEALIQSLNDYNERTNFKHNDAVQKYMSALNSYYDTLGVDNWDESEKKKVWNDVVVGAMSAMPERKEEMYKKLDLERQAQKQDMYLKGKREEREAAMFPHEIRGKILSNQQTALNNNKTLLETQWAIQDRPRSIARQNLVDRNAQLEYDEKEYDFNQKKATQANKTLFDERGGKAWTFGKKYMNQSAKQAIVKHKNSNYDVIVGKEVYRYSGTPGKWVSNNGEIIGEQQLAARIAIADSGATKDKAPTYNDYVQVNGSVRAKNGKYYAPTNDSKNMYMGTDNKLYPASVLNDAPATTTKTKTKAHKQFIPGESSKRIPVTDTIQIAIAEREKPAEKGQGKAKVVYRRPIVISKDNQGNEQIVRVLNEMNEQEYEAAINDLRGAMVKMSQGNTNYTPGERLILNQLGMYNSGIQNSSNNTQYQNWQMLQQGSGVRQQ